MLRQTGNSFGMHFIVQQQTGRGILQHQVQFGHRQPKIQGHENQTQACAGHQGDQLQFVVQAQPGNALTHRQVVRGLQVTGDALYTAPELCEVNVFRLPWHAKAQRQCVRLTLRQRFEALRQF